MSETLSNLDLVENIFKKREEILTNTDKHGEFVIQTNSKIRIQTNFKKSGVLLVILIL